MLLYVTGKCLWLSTNQLCTMQAGLVLIKMMAACNAPIIAATTADAVCVLTDVMFTDLFTSLSWGNHQLFQS